MSKGAKYSKLKVYLRNSGLQQVKLSYKSIEEIIEDSLPESAYKHAEPWWSNNRDHSQATAWMDAGYETEMVSDTHEREEIIFRKL